jgi:hypothetical protein
MTEPEMFAIPAGPAMQLGVEPRLASWNTAGDPDQMKLEAFLAAAEQLLRPRCEQLTGPLALRLDIGLPPTTPLLDQRDLDNYLFPLAVRMSKTTGTRLISVWGTKRHSDASFARRCGRHIRPALGQAAATTPVTSTRRAGGKRDNPDNSIPVAPAQDAPKLGTTS